MRSPATSRLLIAVAALLAAPLSLAYPDKPVQYIIPFVAGGESDVAARLQAQVFSTKFKQEMIVINKPGAGGALAWAQLNAMPADGHTVVGVNLPHIVLQPSSRGRSSRRRTSRPLFLPLHAGCDRRAADSRSRRLPNRQGGARQAQAITTARPPLDREQGIRTAYVPFKGAGSCRRS
jgi:hypothetical protein